MPRAASGIEPFGVCVCPVSRQEFALEIFVDADRNGNARSSSFSVSRHAEDTVRRTDNVPSLLIQDPDWHKLLQRERVTALLARVLRFTP